MDTPPPLPPPTPEHFAEPAGPRPGEAGVVGVAAARAMAPGPRWYRLPDESWAMIRAEYLAGATAKQLAVKWGVSATSVYRHAGQDGFTKARRGEAINMEAVTRFAAQAAAVEARAVEAARAEADEAARQASQPEEEPLVAAEKLLRRAAAAALAGRVEAAGVLLKLAEGLKRAGGMIRGPVRPRLDDEDDGPWMDPEFYPSEADYAARSPEALRAEADEVRARMNAHIAGHLAEQAEARARYAELTRGQDVLSIDRAGGGG